MRSSQPLLSPRLWLMALVSGMVLSACSPAPQTPPDNPDTPETPVDPTPEEPEGPEDPLPVDEPEPEPISFPHDPVAQLPAGTGKGYTDKRNWAPGICFPLEAATAWLNSQVYRPGGSARPSEPNQCAAENYAYPWQDNFCETRGWDNPMCTGGKGHQGQDIRPATCKANQHWAVAAEDGTITQIGAMTVAMTGASPPHRTYRYLHLQSSTLKVKLHDTVKRGQRIGLVSNNLGISNGKQQYTSIHLHFEIRIPQAETLEDGTVLAERAFVSPYAALVDAFDRKLKGDCPPVP